MRSLPFAGSTLFLVVVTVLGLSRTGSGRYIALLLVFFGGVYLTGLILNSRSFDKAVRHRVETGIEAIIWVNVVLLSAVYVVCLGGAVLWIGGVETTNDWDIWVYLGAMTWVSNMHALFTIYAKKRAAKHPSGTE